MPRKLQIKTLIEIKKPWEVEYGVVKTKFGDVQLGLLNGAICFLYFAPRIQLKSNIEKIKKYLLQAEFTENAKLMETIVNKIFSDEGDYNMEIVLTGTEFQNSVWKTLIEIPKGEQWTYSECAEKMGKPSAVRAVANAVASNEISYLIPCHRVVSKDGNKFKYRWGAERKKELLKYEGAMLI